MKCHNITLEIAVICALSACMPIYGHDDSNTPCLGVVSTLGAAESFVDGSHPTAFSTCSTKRKNRVDAPESSKHIFYTESQRLQMAESAAQKLNPDTAVRIAMADVIAASSVGQMLQASGHQNGTSEVYLNCNAMAARHDMGVELRGGIPVEEFYRSVAANWSKTYSDEQLKWIAEAADTQNTDSLDDALAKSAQPKLSTYATYTKVHESYSKVNRVSLNNLATKFYNEIEAQKRYTKKSCSEHSLSDGDYTITQNEAGE